MRTRAPFDPRAVSIPADGDLVATATRDAWDHAIARLATKQHGVVARWQLSALGLTKAAIEHRIRQGRLHRIHPAVYAVGHRVLAPRGWWMAAVLNAGPDALLSHRSAAALQGLIDGSPAVTDVLVLRTGTRMRHVRQHRVREIRPEDRSVVDGIPCTSVPRTLLDLAAGESERTVDRALRRAVDLRVFDLRAIEAVLGRRRQGTVALRAALEIVAHDDASNRITKQELERRFLELLRRHGFVLPETNVVIATRRRDWEVDTLWPRQRLVIELDGWSAHQDRESFRRDHRRGVDVRAAGFEVIRLGWEQVVDDEPGTVELLDRLIPRIGDGAG